ncbi:MAG: hypothetical protein WC718_18180 [Phycisphaerales bacterium]|jgi:hypothetical protein
MDDTEFWQWQMCVENARHEVERDGCPLVSFAATNVLAVAAHLEALEQENERLRAAAGYGAEREAGR